MDLCTSLFSKLCPGTGASSQGPQEATEVTLPDSCAEGHG